MDWFGNKHREHSAKYDNYLQQVHTYDRIVAVWKKCYSFVQVDMIAESVWVFFVFQCNRKKSLKLNKFILNELSLTLIRRHWAKGFKLWDNKSNNINEREFRGYFVIDFLSFRFAHPADDSQGITLEEALVAAERTDEEYKTAKQDVKDMRALTKQLRTAIEIRIDKLRTFRKLIATRARLSFSMNLLKRGYTGSIRFDHKAKTLDIKVIWFTIIGNCVNYVG